MSRLYYDEDPPDRLVKAKKGPGDFDIRIPGCKPIVVDFKKIIKTIKSWLRR